MAESHPSDSIGSSRYVPSESRISTRVPLDLAQKVPPAIPSSSTVGFFQQSPRIQNQFRTDVAFQRALNLFVPLHVHSAINHDLDTFGDRVLSPQVLRWSADAERNPPRLETWDTWGRRKDDLVTSEGWRRLQELGIREGIVAIAYEKKYAQYDRLYQFLKYHLWSASSGGVTCPSAMQDGAAALLSRHLTASSETPKATQKILAQALARLVSRDPNVAWTSGQWMTERPGGSDVRNTETRATFAPDATGAFPNVASDGSPLGPWRIDGFKWFSSATDANMTVLLAKTGDSDQVSAFFAPTRRRVNPMTATKASDELEFNGIQPQRLKNKMGTRSLPTAELVLSGMRAHLLGAVGQGTKEISAILNITRIHNAVSAVGSWGRGLAVSRAFSLVRRTSGKLLADIPAHVKGLAEQHVDYRANMLFTFFVVSLLGIVEHGKLDMSSTSSPLVQSFSQATQLLRLLTPILKALTALASINGLRFCMESLGGVGYLENDEPELNVARQFRDANVLAIWEGTTDVMAADTVRVLKGKGGASALVALIQWSTAITSRWKAHTKTTSYAAEFVLEELDVLKGMFQACDTPELLYRGREVMEIISGIVCTILLVEDALRDGNDVAWRIASRRLNKASKKNSSEKTDWIEEGSWDRRIVFELETAATLSNARL